MDNNTFNEFENNKKTELDQKINSTNSQLLSNDNTQNINSSNNNSNDDNDDDEDDNYSKNSDNDDDYNNNNNNDNNDNNRQEQEQEQENYVNKKPRHLKKNWFIPFGNTYKQKNDDFKKLFKDLPANERLLVDYSCALQKEILVQGRLYISLNYVCFHANILGWEHNLVIKLKDIKAIQKVKIAKIIPNAIAISVDYDRYLFTTFASRDKTYTTLFRMWQSAIYEQSMSRKEIKEMVKSYYGENLDYCSNDEEYKNNAVEQTNTCFSDKETSNNKQNETIRIKCLHKKASTNSITNDSISVDQTKLKETNNAFKKGSLNNIQLKSINSKESIIKNSDFKNANDMTKNHYKSDSLSSEDSLYRSKNRKINRQFSKRQSQKKQTDSSFSSDIDSINSNSLPVKCNCKEHVGKELFNKVYDLSVNFMFECFFGENEFVNKFWESRKFFNMRVGNWEPINDGNEGLVTRRLDYSVLLGGILGQCKNTEHQTLIQYRSNECIIMESLSSSQGIPHADTFEISCRYCITKIDAKRTNIKVHGFVKYLRRPNMVIRGFIERNAMGVLNDAYKYYEQKFPDVVEPDTVTEDISALKNLDSTSKAIITSKSKLKNKNKTHDDTPLKSRRLVSQRSKVVESSYNLAQNYKNTPNSYDSNAPTQTYSLIKYNVNVDTLVRLFIVAMLFLMIINGLLYYKLRNVESLADNLKNDPQLISKYQKLMDESIRKEKQNSIQTENNIDENKWKEIITITLTTLEKMGYMFKDNKQNNDRRQDIISKLEKDET